MFGYSRQVREQSLSHRQEGAVVAAAAKATKKGWGPFMKKLAIDLGVGTASTFAGIAILNKIMGSGSSSSSSSSPSFSSSSSNASATPTTDPNNQYTQGYSNPQYAPSNPNTGNAPSNPNTGYAPSNQNTGYAPSNQNTGYAPSNQNTGYAPSNQNYASRATHASDSSNSNTGAYSTDWTSTNSNGMSQGQADQQPGTDTA